MLNIKIFLNKVLCAPRSHDVLNPLDYIFCLRPFGGNRFGKWDFYCLQMAKLEVFILIPEKIIIISCFANWFQLISFCHT